MVQVCRSWHALVSFWVVLQHDPCADQRSTEGRACDSCRSSLRLLDGVPSVLGCAACAATPELPHEPPVRTGKHRREEPLHFKLCSGCAHTSTSGSETPHISRQGAAKFSLPSHASPATIVQGVVSLDALISVIPPCHCVGGHHTTANIQDRSSPSDCFHTCHCGAPWSTTDPVSNSRETILFTETQPFCVRMYSLCCSRSGCTSLLPYDGLGQGIFAFSPRVAIRESMLISAMVQLSHGTTFDAIATQWQTTYKFTCPAVAYEDLPQRWLLRLLIRSYLPLLPDVDIVCPDPNCGLHPHVLIADGTSLGCKVLLGKHLQPDRREKLPSKTVEMYGAESELFHFIHEASGTKKFRDILYRFILPPRLADGRPAPGGGCSTTKEPRGVAASEFGELVTWCENGRGKSVVVAARLKALAGVLKHIRSLPDVVCSRDASLLQCPESWAHLLQPLAVPSPIWLCHSTAEQSSVLTALKTLNALGGANESAAQLRCRAVLACPFVVDFLDATGLTAFPPVAHNLVDVLCSMAVTLELLSEEPRFSVPAISPRPLTLHQLQSCVSAICTTADEAEAAAPATDATRAARAYATAAAAALVRVSVASDFVETTLAEDRSRGVWASPGFRQRRRQTFAYRTRDDRVDHLCSKDVPDSSGFTPGLLILACPHGYIYYIQFM